MPLCTVPECSPPNQLPPAANRSWRFKFVVMGKQTKDRKRHFTSDSRERRMIMSARLTKDLQQRYGIKRIPIVKGDTVICMKGTSVDVEGKVESVYRKRFQVLVDSIKRKKVNNEEVCAPVNASNLMITDLHLTTSRTRLLARKAKARATMISNRKPLVAQMDCEN
eukprot:GHVH01008739.1.p1 GENE.GHVH01008739.1~~GHVH01008739.1.p1  ORF type:complete len:166 (+),score=26.89 GHVH01008739.1:159-656(+)